MADSCGAYVSADDLKAAKESILHIEHVATSKDANGAPALVVTDPIRGVDYTNATLDGLFSDIGFKPVNGSFEDGGTLNNRWEVLLYEADGSFYQWMGSLPKVVPAGSTPASAGGIGPGAWVDRSDLTLRSELAASDGAELVANGNDTVNNFLYHTPEEFSGSADSALTSSLSATSSDGRTTWIKGTKSLTATIDIPDGVKLQNDGNLTSSATTAAFQLKSSSKLSGGAINNTVPSSAFRVWQGVNDAKAENISAAGAVTSATTPAYGVELYQANDFSMNNTNFSGYSGAINLQQTNRAIITNLTAKNMFFHASLVAGGYGVLTGGTNDTIVSGLQYAAGNTNTSDGYTGRHAIYHSVLRIGGVNYTCTNAIFNNVIANYRDKTVESAGAINIRANTRAIYSNVIIDGSHVSGTAEDGNITSQIFSQGIVRTLKRAEGVSKYGFSWGSTVKGGAPVANITANSILSVAPASGITDTNCYAYELDGSKHILGNLIVDVPGNSTPIIVRGAANNILISDIMDTASPGATGQFILFEPGCSNITLKGIKTNRSMFSGIFNVTDLTVDFPRTSNISINSNVVTTSDNNGLFSSITTSSNNIVVAFRGHVTQAAINSAIASIGKTTAPNMPVVVTRGNKSLTIEFYALNGGALINPQTTPINFSITINT